MFFVGEIGPDAASEVDCISSSRLRCSFSKISTAFRIKDRKERRSPVTDATFLAANSRAAGIMIGSGSIAVLAIPSSPACSSLARLVLQLVTSWRVFKRCFTIATISSDWNGLKCSNSGPFCIIFFGCPWASSA